ncbi:MAG: hypothetical protein Q8M17_12925 [Actinomycetota bacterium]|nr:hypothetical protein [Actinomycetota bacterium]
MAPARELLRRPGDAMPHGQPRPPHERDPWHLVIAGVAFLLAAGILVLWIALA